MSDEMPPSKLGRLVRRGESTPARLTAEQRPGFEAFIDRWRVLFERKHDPFDLWAAYVLYRVCGLPIPAWILVEFDAIAARLGVNPWGQSPGVLDRATKDRWTVAIAEAFGFPRNPRGGIQDPINRWLKNSRDIRLAFEVRQLVDGNGNNETNAVMLVADRQKVSEPTVRRAWREFAPFVRLFTLRKDRRTRRQNRRS